MKIRTLIYFLIIIFTLSSAYADTTDQNANNERKQNLDEGIGLARELRNKNTNLSTIRDILINGKKYEYGSAEFSKDQYLSLKEKFDDDFIKEWAGIPQYV